MKTINNQQGAVMLWALITVTMFIGIALAISALSFEHFASSKRTLSNVAAISAAEAGADKCLFELNNGAACPATGSIGNATYSNTISAGGFAGEQIITSVGKYYADSAHTPSRLLSTRTIKLTVSGSPGFLYGLQSDNGLIYIANNVNIVSSIHTNGYIKMHSNAQTISPGGQTIEAFGVDPIDKCSIYDESGTGGNILGPGAIKLSPESKNHTDPVCGNNTYGPGLTVNKTAASAALPNVTTPTGLTPRLCSITEVLQPDLKYHIPSGEYDCDLVLTKPLYVLEGDVYVKNHKMTMTSRSTVIIDDAITSTPSGYVTVAVDGIVRIKDSSVVANSTGIGATIVSRDSSHDPTCLDNDPPNPSSNGAIDISGNGLSIFANFLASNGSITYHGRGSIGRIAGKCLAIDGTGTTTILDIVPPVGGTPALWTVKYYQQVFN